jgi:hypothetical protein
MNYAEALARVEAFAATQNRRLLLIPEYCPVEPDRRYPGDIKPGWYRVNDVVDMLRRFKHEPDVIQFIADLLEE